MNRITIEEARRLLEQEGYHYIDVRTEVEFTAGHPAAAYNVPYPNDDFLSVMRALFDKNDKLVIGCQGGKRSFRAAEALIADGFTDIAEMRAGYGGVRNAFGLLTEKGWLAAGFPTGDGTSYTDLKAQMR
jgi:rhodanese-related sulfurtransferase